MFDWIKNITKESPVFWKKYTASFNDEATTRFVVLSIEKSNYIKKTGFSLAIHAIGIIDDQIHVGDSLELKLKSNRNLQKELIATDNEALELFLDYISNAVLVGYRLDDYFELINEILESLACGKLKNQAIDLEVMHNKLNNNGDKVIELKQLLELYKVPSIHNAATTSILSISLLFLKLKYKLGIT